MKRRLIMNDIYNFAKSIQNFPRSLTGNGVRQTLSAIKKINNNLKKFEIPTGTKVFDWTVPKEWNVIDAYIINPKGKKICDYKNNVLNLVSYSYPFKGKMNLEKLNKHLYSIPKQPFAIPYVTSYYKQLWGFCISHNKRKKLKKGIYKVIVNTKLFKGHLTYGEILIKGKNKKEILLSTNICHPIMGNNEISGISVLTYLSQWISEIKNKKYSYRIIFIPETIGSITYICKNFKNLKKNIIAGFVLSCVGDERSYSFIPSRAGNTLSDKVAKHILKWKVKKYNSYTWMERGSDERQFCAPGVDLPVCSVLRSKHGYYPEYHTSLDKLGTVATKKGLGQSFKLYQEFIMAIEKNCIPKTTSLCEPFLQKKNLYPKERKNISFVSDASNFISLSDGKNDLIDIAEKCNLPVWNLYELVEILKKKKLIVIKNIA